MDVLKGVLVGVIVVMVTQWMQAKKASDVTNANTFPAATDTQTESGSVSTSTEMGSETYA